MVINPKNTQIKPLANIGYRFQNVGQVIRLPGHIGRRLTDISGLTRSISATEVKLSGPIKKVLGHPDGAISGGPKNSTGISLGNYRKGLLEL